MPECLRRPRIFQSSNPLRWGPFENKGDLVVDLSGIKKLDLASLALLLTAQQKAEQEDRDVWLAGVPLRSGRPSTPWDWVASSSPSRFPVRWPSEKHSDPRREPKAAPHPSRVGGRLYLWRIEVRSRWLNMCPPFRTHRPRVILRINHPYPRSPRSSSGSHWGFSAAFPSSSPR